MQKTTLISFAFLAFFLAHSAHADTCRITKTHDGDTVSVRCGNKKSERIRLLDIDAPEMDQPYGKRAKTALKNVCRHQTVTLVRHGKDKYRRTLARLYCGDIDVQAHLVANGWAWALRKATDPQLPELQKIARRERRGLWAADKPVPPWTWRHRK